MLIVGDVHGKIDKFKQTIAREGIPGELTIQVGDFGFKQQWDYLAKMFSPEDVKIVMGNHDYTEYKYKSPFSIGDFKYFPEYDLFCIRGAESYDKSWRTLGVDLFPDEQLSYKEGMDALDAYLKYKPSTVISHDCPEYVRMYLFNIHDRTLTSSLLQAMWDNHQPDTWIFGHHHRSKNVVLENTRFICLNELEPLYLPLEANRKE